MAEKRSSTFALSDKWYNILKKLVQIVLPAFGTFYFALAGIWGLPYADQVTGTILATCTFVGICLGISTAQYNASGRAFDGHITVTPTSDGVPTVTAVHYNGMPGDLTDKQSITLQVQSAAPLKPEEDSEDDLEPVMPPPHGVQ